MVNGVEFVEVKWHYHEEVDEYVVVVVVEVVEVVDVEVVTYW